MYIKSINNVIGYKGLPDGFNIEFDENKTYIVGANFQGKTTIGSLFNWCLTGTSLNGKEKEQISNDTKKVSNVIVDITFVDNFGIEHRLIRDKGKEIHITLDGKEIEQGNLAQYYKNKDIFLVAYNPYYFWTLEPKEQKDLIRNILPNIEPEEAFNLLSDYDKAIIEKPIDNLSSYTDRINQEINSLEKEYNQNIGTISTLKSIALEQEGSLLKFDKENELKKLQDRYEDISLNFDNSNLEDLKRKIDTINIRLQKILTEDLSKISEQYNRESNKLKEVDKEQPICPSCRQEIKDIEAKEHLKQFFKKEMIKLQEKADILKEDAKQINLFDEINESQEKNNSTNQEKYAMYANSIAKLQKITIKKLQEINAIDLFYNIDMPTIEVLSNMQWNGMYVDEKELNQIGEELSKSLQDLTKTIYEMAGQEFNINSPKQLGEILFEKMKLPVIKKTKSGYSTDVDVLEKLKKEDPIIEKILEYRQIMKLNSTYVEGLKPYINPKTKRIHSFFHQTITATRKNKFNRAQFTKHTNKI